MDFGKGKALVVFGNEPRSDLCLEVTELFVRMGWRVDGLSRDASLGDESTESPDLLVLPLCESDAATANDYIQRVRERYPQCALFVMSSAAGAHLLAAALQSGADDYFLLPLADQRLFEYQVGKCVALANDRNRRASELQKLTQLNQRLTDSLQVMQRDQRAGFQVQQRMMPESPGRIGNLTFTHRIIPSLILSGDFIDYFSLADGRSVFYIADVSGHGAGSAFVTVLLKSLSQRLERDYSSLGLSDTAAILDWFNRELLCSELQQHVTMFLGIFDRDEGALEYSNAAHFPGTIFSSANFTDYLAIGGLPLGLYPGASYEKRQLELPGQFSLVMFSDGVFEVMPQSTLKAKENYLLSLVREGRSNISSIVERLGLDKITEAPDDIALFTIARAA